MISTAMSPPVALAAHDEVWLHPTGDASSGAALLLAQNTPGIFGPRHRPSRCDARHFHHRAASTTLSLVSPAMAIEASLFKTAFSFGDYDTDPELLGWFAPQAHHGGQVR